MASWLEVRLTSRLHLVCPNLEDFHVKGTTEEVGYLGQHLWDRNVGWGWVSQDEVKFLEVRSLESDIVPVFLESLFGHLLDILNDLVCEDWEFDFKAGFHWRHWTALRRKEKFRADQIRLLNHAHDNDLGRLTRLIADWGAFDLI